MISPEMTVIGCSRGTLQIRSVTPHLLLLRQVAFFKLESDTTHKYKISLVHKKMVLPKK